MRLTPEQQARQKQIVEENILNQHFTIEINQMIPMRGPARMVQDYSLTVKDNHLVSYLPYFGVAYSVPYGGGSGLNFEADIDEYFDQPFGDRHEIAIVVRHEQDVFLYNLTIFENGRASLTVRSRNREQISFNGEMEVEL